MFLLAGALKWVLGSSKLLTLGIVGGFLIMGQQLWAARDARLKSEATAKCEASWELAQTKAKLKIVIADAKAAQDTFDLERKTTETLQNEHDKIRQEFAA